jgi:hypothetical protein
MKIKNAIKYHSCKNNNTRRKEMKRVANTVCIFIKSSTAEPIFEKMNNINQFVKTIQSHNKQIVLREVDKMLYWLFHSIVDVLTIDVITSDILYIANGVTHCSKIDVSNIKLHLRKLYYRLMNKVEKEMRKLGII